MSVRTGLIAAAMTAIALWTAPAMAQDTKVKDLTEAQQDEIFCVYDKLGDDFVIVAEAFLYDDMPAEEVAKATAAMDRSAGACAANYHWNDAKRGMAARIGRYGSVADYLEGDLFAEDVKETDVDKIYEVVNGLPVADRERFRNESWMEDAAFITRMDQALAGAGFPKGDDDYLFETARFMMEAAVLASYQIAQWVEN